MPTSWPERRAWQRHPRRVLHPRQEQRACGGTFGRSGAWDRSTRTGSGGRSDDFLHDFGHRLDARNHGLTLRVEELDTRNGLQRANLESFTHLELGHVNRDRLGKIFRKDAHAKDV